MVPRLQDLAILWPVLATAGTGQPITCYNTLIGGPRKPNEADGPEEFHVILLDNGRSELLADVEQRDVLQCIRCGACLNVCPVFRTVGGHTYGTTYPGPIGSVLTPHLRGLDEFQHLSYASSLCGACTDACPVKIDLHHHLLENRRNAVSTSHLPVERARWVQGLAVDDAERCPVSSGGKARAHRNARGASHRAGRNGARSARPVVKESRGAGGSEEIVPRDVGEGRCRKLKTAAAKKS